MALTDNQRKEIWMEFMRQASNRQELIGTTLTKIELRSAVNAIDNWIDSNAASFNNALPNPANTQLTNKQKYEIFKMVLTLKYNEEVT
jgi:hypothetical protein